MKEKTITVTCRERVVIANAVYFREFLPGKHEVTDFEWERLLEPTKLFQKSASKESAHADV